MTAERAQGVLGVDVEHRQVSALVGEQHRVAYMQVLRVRVQHDRQPKQQPILNATLPPCSVCAYSESTMSSSSQSSHPDCDFSPNSAVSVRLFSSAHVISRCKKHIWPSPAH